jgi:methyl coenzyme M reductase subunit D
LPTFTGTPDIDILPRRLIDRKRAEDLSTIIRDMEEVEEVLTKNYPYRGGGHVVGRLIVVLRPGADHEAVVSRLKPVIEQSMPFGYDIRFGRFVKPKPTLKDYMKGRRTPEKKD